MSEEQATGIMKLKPSQVSDRVLVVGDPARAAYVASLLTVRLWCCHLLVILLSGSRVTFSQRNESKMKRLKPPRGTIPDLSRSCLI